LFSSAGRYRVIISGDGASFSALRTLSKYWSARTSSKLGLLFGLNEIILLKMSASRGCIWGNSSRKFSLGRELSNCRRCSSCQGIVKKALSLELSSPRKSVMRESWSIFYSASSRELDLEDNNSHTSPSRRLPLASISFLEMRYNSSKVTPRLHISTFSSY